MDPQVAFISSRRDYLAGSRLNVARRQSWPGTRACCDPRAEALLDSMLGSATDSLEPGFGGGGQPISSDQSSGAVLTMALDAN
ncbi:hypothetical protein SNOG_01027 [Parastagonospora nodorum SN15]|uniref:Uncharacterized protein n=1 Tax=Phaeosphaeria nodorum (strain SN15 / ATCC MYA-4574 / FGSC 10173) TaxID=321614 RepID=Q0V4N7_PHANO|nr:hypothetical protein SNOG_01027 [Parastagonospora nodorum SN15]EAT92522.1 hypothetical protein SNOG_01027 [Parastagonospora nodorum SN15]